MAQISGVIGFVRRLPSDLLFTQQGVQTELVG
jgi:hypothetical protein